MSKKFQDRLGRRSASDGLVKQKRRQQWMRVRMDEDIADFVAELSLPEMHVAEVSGESWNDIGARSYTSLKYPQFDLCDGRVPEMQFDLVFCEQVLEHVVDPVAAVRKLHDLVVPGGRLVVSTPFLVKLHSFPVDHWRFSPTGLRTILERGGLSVLSVKAWGNRWCVFANLGSRWIPRFPLQPGMNEPQNPVVVWAFATRN